MPELRQIHSENKSRMPLMNLYFTPALLFLVLSCPVWVVSRSLPGTDNKQMNKSCVSDARKLLENITDALMQPKLFSGINCTSHNMELNLETRTPTVCAPVGSTCSGMTTSVFDWESCKMEIENDLSYYYKLLSAQPDPDSFLGSSVLYSLKKLLKCFNPSLSMDLKEVPVERLNTYNERLKLCKVMKGFHVRTITINRAIGYMTLGEHTN